MPKTAAYSAVLAAHTLWLARAVGVGLGWVSILDPVAVVAALDVPPGWTFVGYFCLGYPLARSEEPELQSLFSDWVLTRQSVAHSRLLAISRH